MKHVRILSRKAPAGADAFQDATCKFILGASSLLGFIGGTAPVLSYLEEKCALPTPNDDGEGGETEQ